MFDKNVATLVGRLGHHPEVRKISETGCFVVLSIATNERKKNKKGEIVEDTQWHKVHFNNWLGKKAASLKKGDRIYVSGKYRSDSWEDKEGNKHYSVFIEATEFELFAKQESENNLSSDPESVDEESSNLETDVRALLNKYSSKNHTASKED